METRFSSPLQLVSPAGEIVEIEGVRDALRFLDAWPSGRRGPVYQCAARGCQAALEGHLTVEEARSAVANFAHITGIVPRNGHIPVGIARFHSSLGTSR